jgi:hypothetical protein
VQSLLVSRKPSEPLPPPPSCGDNNCINPHTNKTYWLEDICDPEIFNKVWQKIGENLGKIRG